MEGLNPGVERETRKEFLETFRTDLSGEEKLLRRYAIFTQIYDDINLYRSRHTTRLREALKTLGYDEFANELNRLYGVFNG